MDYCHTCQRTLNGALACPGCGVYGLGTGFVADGRDAQTMGAYSYPPFADSGTGGGGEGDIAADDSVLGPASLAPTLHSGRAARRRQMDRWKKSRRRAGVATAVALFGGGVASLAMNSHSGRSTTAAAATTDDMAPVPQTSHVDSDPVTDLPSTDGTTGSRAPRAPVTRTVALAPGTGVHTLSVPSGQVVKGADDGGGSATVTNLHAPAGHANGSHPAAGGTSQSTGSTAPGTGVNPGTNTGGDNTSATPPPTTAPSTPPPTTTAPPQQLCLLVICFG